VLLDLGLPDLSGHEVLAQLKAGPTTSGIPVVIITSKILDDDERRRLEALAVAIVSKGSDTEAARTQIRAALARAGLASAEREGPWTAT
jgi:DNA-binding response OmpR family regulator